MCVYCSPVTYVLTLISFGCTQTVYKSLEVNAIDLTGDGTTDFINALPISITDQCEPKYRPLALDGLQENTTSTPPVQPPVPPPDPVLLTLPAEGGTAEQPGRAALAPLSCASPLSAAEAQQQLGGAGRSPAQTAAERRQVPYAEKGEALRSLGERIAAAQPCSSAGGAAGSRRRGAPASVGWSRGRTPGPLAGRLREAPDEKESCCTPCGS